MSHWGPVIDYKRVSVSEDTGDDLLYTTTYKCRVTFEPTDIDISAVNESVFIYAKSHDDVQQDQTFWGIDAHTATLFNFSGSVIVPSGVEIRSVSINESNWNGYLHIERWYEA